MSENIVPLINSKCLCDEGLLDENIDFSMNALLYSIQEKSYGIVQLLLDKGEDVNKRDCYKRTSLHYVLMIYSHEDKITIEKLVATMLEKGAEVNALDHRYSTPLHYAVKRRNCKIIELLLDKGANLDSRDCFDHTPLHCALTEIGIRYKDDMNIEDLVSLLVERGADINAVDNNLSTALHYAVKADNSQTLQQVRIKEAEMNDYDSKTPFQYAIEICRTEEQIRAVKLVRRLIDLGADVNAVDDINSSALHYAFESKYPQVVTLLVDEGANVNQKSCIGQTPLHCATREPSFKQKDRMKIIDLVRTLIEKGAVVDALDDYKNTPLQNAVKNRYYQVVELLLDHGADPNLADLDDQTTLHYAVKEAGIQIKDRRKNKEVVKLLIERGANVNVLDKHMSTPLHLAVFTKNKPLIEILIQNGADVNLATRKSSPSLTPLHYALALNYNKGFRILMKNGAKVNVRDTLNKTPLHTACLLNSERYVTMLLKNGADVRAKCGRGRTPFHEAVAVKSLPIVEMLLAAGADINVRDKNGNTPLHVSSDNYISFNPNDSLEAQNAFFQQRSICNLLLSKGAELFLKNRAYQTPIEKAISVGALDIVSQTLKHMSDADRVDNPFLHKAVFKVFYSNLVDLIVFKADFYTQNRFHIVSSRDRQLMEISQLILDFLTWGLPIVDIVSDNKVKKLAVHSDCTVYLIDVAKHFIKLKCAGLLTKENCDSSVQSLAQTIQEYEDKCKNEIKCMKATEYSGQSLFYVFSNYRNSFPINNKELEEAVKSETTSAQFPEYIGLLRAFLKRSRWRSALLDETELVFDVMLPTEMRRMVLANLSDKDLKNVNAAFRYSFY